MKITVLGSGGATGVPVIGRGWGKCDPANPRNRRRRPSILVEKAGTVILVDTAPDLRDQLLDAEVSRLDAVIYTHAHADHLHGIDDLRDVNRAMEASIDVWADPETLKTIDVRFPYVFTPQDPSASFIYKPLLNPRTIDGPFQIGAVAIQPYWQDHGYSQSLGFRFGRFAYSTDLVDLSEEGFDALAGLDLWLVACTLDFKHSTHAWTDRVMGWIERLKPKRTVLTHLSYYMDYETLKRQTPEGIEPAYDGMVLEVDD